MKRAPFLNGRLWRAIFLAAAAVALATITPPGPVPSAGPPAAAPLETAAVPLHAEDRERRQVGALRFRRGWDLDSPEPRFGGISAIQVENGQVTAISDAGVLMFFALPPDRPPHSLRVRPLTMGAADEKSDRDTESMLLDGNHAWVGFERQNAVARFRRSDWRLESRAQPRAMRRWRGNSGAEGMVRLPDGRFLIFSEGEDDEQAFSNVALFDGDPAQPGTRAVALRYRRVPGYRVTDAALLPDRRLLVLNRRFGPLEGISASLVIVPLEGLRPGATLQGREIARLSPPIAVDNMEALSVTREGGQTIVRIASDDNFMALQRTLLLEFELVE
ncbi:MAG TPA: esterase-like activity of phytase family protein [Allosphingosinicella sp.]|jgi:hypothetical protein